VATGGSAHTRQRIVKHASPFRETRCAHARVCRPRSRCCATCGSSMPARAASSASRAPRYPSRSSPRPVPARGCSRIWSRARTSTRSQRLQRPTEFARAASGGGGTAIISRGDCRERRGSSVMRPVRLHAPHSGETPEFASLSQRVSRPLMRAVVLVLRRRIRLAT